jgi:predicted transcriptional regulator
MKSIVIGIMPQEKIRARVLSIARGEYKPKASEPKIWFTSMRSLAEVLSDENRALLKLISENHPESITSLAELTGRRTSNLSRTLKTMANYGLIEMQREKNQVRPVAKATEFRIVAQMDRAVPWSERTNLRSPRAPNCPQKDVE